MRRWARSVFLGLITGALGMALVATDLGEEFEKEFGLSWMFKVRGPVEPPAEVAVVGIDGSSGAKLGISKLPRDWPRSVHGEMVKALVAHGAAVIVFDFDFSRPREPEEDQAFADAIAEAKRVVLLERLVGKRQPLYGADGSPNGWIWMEERLPPVGSLLDAAKALGPFPLPKKGESAFQFWTFKSSAGDAPTTPSLALQLYLLSGYEQWRGALKLAGVPGLDALPRAASDIRTTGDVGRLMSTLRSAFRNDPALRQRTLEVIDDGGLPSQVRKSERVLLALTGLYAGGADRYLNFYGPPGTIKTFEYSTLIGKDPEGRGPRPGDLDGKVVFVGYSDLYEPDKPDRYYTVFTNEHGVDLNGVEIMATAFANLVTDRSVRWLERDRTAAIAFFFGFSIGFVIYMLPALIGVPLTFASAGLYAFGAQWAFEDSTLWLPLATPELVQLPFALLVGLMFQYLLKRRAEQKMTRAISYYLPENIVRDLTEKELDPDSVNRVVYGACLATDMSGFSTISEDKTPQELATFMNAYFETVAQALKQHQVDVTEFHADTIMCAWTAPEPRASVRLNATLAAIDAVDAIDWFDTEHGTLGLNARIGLQAGHFYLGHTGGGGRFAYTILGDPANTASRLEGLNKHLGTHLLAAAAVVEGLDGLLLRPVGSFRLKGKADTTPVVEILAGGNRPAGAEQTELCERFAEALDLFLARRWDGAASAFEGVVERFPGDGPSTFYLETCREYAAGSAPGEDPHVIRMTEK